METNTKHYLHYTISAIIFIAGLVLIFLNGHDQKLQLAFIIMTATFYFMWSLVHHSIHHQLNTHVVIEYMLIVSLGTILSFFLVQI